MIATKKKIIVTAVCAAILALGVTAGVMRSRTPAYTYKGSHFTDSTIALGESSSDAAAKAAIRARYKEALTGIVNNDVEGLSAMMVDSWKGTIPADISGTGKAAITNKSQWREHRFKLDRRMLTRTTFDCAIKSIVVEGDRVTVRILWDAHYNLGKQRQTDDIHLDEDQWVRRNGIWMWTSDIVLTDRGLVNGKPAS